MSAREIFSLIFLPPILLIGVKATYQDLIDSKIKNKWILLGLAYVFLVYLSSWALHFLALMNISLPILQNIANSLIWNFDKWCLNLIISFLVAYSLWRYRLWGAGDAKLFICYSALIPMGQYSKVYFKYYFASFLLLLAIFIPATLYFFLRSSVYLIKRFDYKAAVRSAKERFNKTNLFSAAKVLFAYVVFFLILNVIRQEFTNLIGKLIRDQNILILASLLIFNPLSKIVKKNTKVFIVISLLLFYIAYMRGQFFSGIAYAFLNAAVVMIIFSIIKKIFALYSARVAQETTPFAIWIFFGALLTWFLK